MPVERKAAAGAGVVLVAVTGVLVTLAVAGGHSQRACESTVSNWTQLNAWASEGVLRPLALLLNAC